MFGYEATKMCIVDVFSGEKNGLFLSLTMVPTEEEAPKPELLGAQITASQDNRQTLDVLTTPLWYVFSPDTTLMSLGRINVLSETSAPL
jgi:hypothetical protein